MLQRFREFVNNNQLFSVKDKLLLAVSGGVDSMVLLWLAHQLKLNCEVAHCNFSLREEDSIGDQLFVKETCENYGIRFHTITFDTHKIAEERKESTQMVARDLRYSWFSELKESYGFDYILTAHHRDDEIETFFINLIRGSGLRGLKGIPAKTGHLVRPLLFAWRKEVEQFAVLKQINWREDRSNATDDYLRNKIRHQLVPVLKELSVEAASRTSLSIDLLRFASGVFDDQIKELSNECIRRIGDETRVDLLKLKHLDKQPYWLFELLSPFGFNLSHCKAISRSLNETTGKQFFSPTHRLIRERDYLSITQKELKVNSKKVPLIGNEGSIKEPVNLTWRVLTLTGSESIPKTKDRVWVDFDRIQESLYVRFWEEGDWFIPFGMKGRKKLSDFFTDRKLSRREKETTPLLLAGSDVVWVIGSRIDDRFAVKPSTSRVLELFIS